MLLRWCKSAGLGHSLNHLGFAFHGKQSIALEPHAFYPTCHGWVSEARAMDSIKSIVVSRCDAEFTPKFPKRLNPNLFPQWAKLTGIFSRKELGGTPQVSLKEVTFPSLPPWSVLLNSLWLCLLSALPLTVHITNSVEKLMPGLRVLNAFT